MFEGILIKLIKVWKKPENENRNRNWLKYNQEGKKKKLFAKEDVSKSFLKCKFKIPALV